MSSPTGQPTSYPTTYPTSRPTAHILYVPEYVVVWGALVLAFCLCVAVCCCRKGKDYKKKIYQMMDEAKVSTRVFCYDELLYVCVRKPMSCTELSFLTPIATSLNLYSPLPLFPTDRQRNE